jgi:GT2 family glycosyltransferase
MRNNKIDTVITGSLVTYHNSKNDISSVINSFLGDSPTRILFVIDNSNENSLSNLCTDERIRYLFNGKNLGFGTAHNIAFKLADKLGSHHHFLLNPDINFNSKIIDELVSKIKADNDIGMIMPKVLYPDGSHQFLCKLLPSPFDLFVRRFVPNSKFKENIVNKYELKSFSYDYELEIPCLSGCFLLVRLDLIKKNGGFDERYFMYLEDVDLCRKIQLTSKTIFYPYCSVVHNYEKGSYKNKKLLFYHIRSAIKYFNKWGWFFDSKRREINSNTLKKLNNKIN